MKSGAAPVDKSKRDEWGEGGVMCLLDEYESKWVLRNRAKLKANDWDEISSRVSAHGGAAKSATQCKNKIESLKKRYRMESSSSVALASASPWRFFDRVGSLLKGSISPQPKVLVDDDAIAIAIANDGLEKKNQKMVNQNHVGDNGIEDCDDGLEKKDQKMVDQNHVGDNGIEGCDEGPNSEPSEPKRRIGIELGSINGFKRQRFGSGVGESFKFLADSMMRIEQGRIEMYKESERLRSEAEVRRAEMEVRRTEIIAQTQLQIAKLFVKRLSSERDEAQSSSLRAEPAIATDLEGEHKNG